MQKILRRMCTLLTPALLLAACAGERPVNLGVIDGALAACPESPNCVSSFAPDPGHHIAPFHFEDPPGEAFQRLHAALAQRTDTVFIEEREAYLRVEFHTLLFVDDGEFLLDTQHNHIQLRSASRIGHSDLGKNRRRLEEVRKEFEKTP